MLEGGQELSARFVLVRTLGAGGSGEVWLAQDRERQRLVAVKVLSPQLTGSVEAVAALEREAARAAALEHPNILKIDGLHRSPAHVWLAMEYVSGGDLSSWRGRAAVDIARVTLPIAHALAFAHRAGAVHRDVKPANVLLTSDGIPKLADFGMSLDLAQTPAAQAGRGSIFTMSPQQKAGEAAQVGDDIYSFGALLYELLSGYPPFYPDAQAGTHRPKPLANVPTSLADLVDQCLAAQPADRPADMATVARRLESAMADLPTVSIVNTPDTQAPKPVVAPPELRPPLVTQGEPLRSEWRRPQATARNDDDLRRQGFRRGLGAAALVLGVIGVGLVFFALPRWFAEKPVAASAKVEKASPETPTPAKKKELDFAALARAKQDADDVRAEIEARLDKLRARAVEQWGGAELKLASDELAAGDQDYAAREYVSAVQHFSAIDPLLDQLEQRAGEVLARELAAGNKALEEGRSADAKSAFELAATVDPSSAAASRGLKRAGTLDEVLALVADGERFEKEGNLVAANETFNRALRLDPDMARAAEGSSRVGARLAGDAFASNMARGYSELAAGRYGPARAAFEAAARIRSGAPEIAQALRQIEQEEKTRSIEAKLASAAESEKAERWDEALLAYRAVAELDSTVTLASDGIARTQPRAQLNEQLEMYLTQPERLFSTPVRNAARSTLQNASAIEAPGPVLQKQLATLRDWLARAEVPVRVALQSDNMTQVTIQRIGALGSFEQRSLTLAPGSYTVVGTRPGYRDVRREINIVPGAHLDPIVVRCEEKI